MFSIISNSLYKGIYAREQELTQEIRTIARELHVDEKIRNHLFLASDTTPLNACPASATRINYPEAISWIHVNPFWLLDWSDLPKDLQIKGSTDPKLHDRAFIQKICDSVADIFDLTRVPVTLEHILIVRFYVKLSEKPELAKCAWRSMIAHELGHVHHNHGAKEHSVITTKFPMSGLINKIAELFQTRRQECEADQFAAQNLKDALKGAEYGFTCGKRTIMETKASSILTFFEKIVSKIFLMGDDIIFDRFTHGSLETRIDRFKYLTPVAA